MAITSAAVLITLALTVVFFGLGYYYLSTRHRERLALLERGLPPTTFKRSGTHLPLVLLIGILCIGVAAGIAAGAFLRELPFEHGHEFAYPLTIFFFSGLSLVVAYYILRAWRPQE